MSLKIQNLPDAPKSSAGRFQSDLTFQIKGGYSDNGVPVASTTIVFTSDDSDVVAALAAKFGGDVEELNVEKGNPFRLVSEATELELLLDNSGGLSARFALYGQAGLMFATDGEVITDGETPGGATKGDVWEDRPETLKKWKDRANKGYAPKPDIRLRGKIVGLEDLGFGQYRTSGWSLVGDLPDIEEKLETKESPIRVNLALGKVEFTTKAGDDVSYTRPYITVL
jgi:hypothetical protein